MSPRKKTTKRTPQDEATSSVEEETEPGREAAEVLAQLEGIEVFTTADGTVSCRPVAK